MRRALASVAAFLAFVLLAASPAAAHTTTTARSGEGVIRIVQRVCGTSQGWQQVAAENGITAASGYRVLRGQTLSVGCQGGTATPPSSSSQTAAWLHPLPGTCRPPYGGGEFGAPRDGGSRRHQGIDLGSAITGGAPFGAPIRAVRAGTVVAVGWSGGAGLRVQIRHDGGWLSKYNHLSAERVSVGQFVAAGQVIGSMGATGNAQGAHLHIELWLNGEPKDPRLILPVRC